MPRMIDPVPCLAIASFVTALATSPMSLSDSLAPASASLCCLVGDDDIVARVVDLLERARPTLLLMICLWQRWFCRSRHAAAREYSTRRGPIRYIQEGNNDRVANDLIYI